MLGLAKAFQSLATIYLSKPQIAAVLKVDAGSLVLSADDSGSRIIDVPPGKPVGDQGLRHGDILYVAFRRANEPTQPTNTSAHHLVKQNAIDDYMENLEGTVKRGRDRTFCKHGPSGMCEYCLPLQPWDSKYLEENKIKHMSFHAYLRQLRDKNKTAPVTSPQFLPPLDELELKVKVPCPGRGHESWPAGICTKCQPGAVTLQSQNFRMVDHIEFETAGMIENFLKCWRSTGYQRFGYLYGRYEPYPEIPLGVKAVVSAIYEPPQEGAYDGLQLIEPDPDGQAVEEIAQKLGLVQVGMIYTDLTDDGSGTGKVVCKRHADSYFLSSAECILAAENQLKHPVPSKWCETGRFGSRFVTCVLVGNLEGGIDISSFQVSNTAMAMVRDNIIEASVEPTLMRVKQLTTTHYVPEVFYKYKNEYGLMVQDAARPTFPVEYLLITVTHGFPQAPSPTFISSKSFPIENRPGIDLQDLGALQRHLSSAKLTEALSDFHAVLYVCGLGVVDQAGTELVAQIARTHDEALAKKLLESESWQNLVMIMKESPGFHNSTRPSIAGQASNGSISGGRSTSGEPWGCKYCTFVNAAGAGSCDMCGLPND
ncbi:nuclear protein localization protein 4 [Geranomyces michiganensis]|nr:nuclear protein localization protein 4 [Geranomyces michiganensis]